MNLVTIAYKNLVVRKIRTSLTIAGVTLAVIILVSLLGFDAGYEKAFSTILDANITTALAGFILLNYTSGPIRGFAVTLLLGILCSVFTAVYVSRRIFNWWVESRQPESLSI